MLSRCNFPKNKEKYCNSFHILTAKYTTERLSNVAVQKIVDWKAKEKFSDEEISLNKIQFHNFKQLFSKSSRRFSNLKDQLLLSSVAGVALVHKPSVVEDLIPEPPSIPVQGITDAVSAAGEPPFASLGLGGWSPVGMIQNCLEYVHVTLDVPWWGAIIVGTIVVRLLMFPLVIMAQRNAAKMNNHLPQVQYLQLKMSEARQTGNQLDAARYGQEMLTFMKEKQLSPLKNVIVPLAQMPLFVSFFIGLRQMANCPVESMREGGLFWFTDLTLPDQYFLLPIITSLTMWATIELGTDSAKLSSQNMYLMKYVLRALPVIVFPFTINFPGAILCYWVCTNFISLIQVGILRIPSVRDYFKIETLVNHNPDSLPVKNKGFVSGVKESWTNMKLSGEIENRRRYDEMQFQRAGAGPIVKTYKFDPTKSSVSTVSTKKE